jgi:hypothetical protein
MPQTRRSLKEAEVSSALSHDGVAQWYQATKEDQSEMDGDLIRRLGFPLHCDHYKPQATNGRVNVRPYAYYTITTTVLPLKSFASA